jgi:hypothetical protein
MSSEDPNHQSNAGTPRWVKVFGIIALIVIVLFVILMFMGGPGGHGPRRHMSSGDVGGRTAPSSVEEIHRLTVGIGE